MDLENSLTIIKSAGETEFLFVEPLVYETEVAKFNNKSLVKLITIKKLEDICLIVSYEGYLPGQVFIDSGFRTREVYEVCKKHGYNAVKFYKGGMKIIEIGIF